MIGGGKRRSTFRLLRLRRFANVASTDRRFRRFGKPIAAVGPWIVAIVAFGLGGWVAAVMSGVYVALAIRAARRHRAAKRDEQVRSAAEDIVLALAMGLRAGLSPAQARDAAGPA